MVLATRAAWAACVLVTLCGAHVFEAGLSHHYTYWAENSLLNDQHNVTTVLKFHIQAVNRTEDGHRLHSLHVDSLVQYVKHGMLLNNPMQWDLSKSFLFVSEDTGYIRVVHCHPEDREELVVIKKAVVSIFSVHVQIEEDRERWDYTVTEDDHLGSLTHNYSAHRTASGMKLNRKHSSSDTVFRTHEKTLHYDQQGTLHTALATDNVLLKDRRPKTRPSALPGEIPHNVDSSGDFPDIEARATVRVTLESKQPNEDQAQEVFDDLTAQTLETKPKPRPVQTLEEVRQNISRVFECLRQFPQKDSENRSMCVNDLRSVLSVLDKGDYARFVKEHLGSGCPSNDTFCREQRVVVIDVVARMGDETSQELLVTHVLSREPAVEEELRRVFIHCVAIEHPTERFLQSVESVCSGPQGEHHGTRRMSRTQSGACLAVGTLARHLHHRGHLHTADSVVHRLETWLDRHAQGDRDGDVHVSKRAAEPEDSQEEEEQEQHDVSKAVLLHALGNAALSRSRRHLVTHARPNRGRNLWRRAALDAMRHYNCTETAKSMLASIMHDDTHSVRQMALSVYVKHPRRHEVFKDYENVILSENYTYPAVARVKRSVLEEVLVKFKVSTPKLDWKKELGSKSVGASFGVHFENSIDVLFRDLSGYVDLAVHDKVWAEIHLGVINKEWSIFHAEICYKGRLSYNLNIMKDYTVNHMKDIASAFDHIAKGIIEPLENTVNQLTTMYHDKDTNETRSGFQLLATAVRTLPTDTEGALQSTVELSNATQAVSGLPLLSKLQQLAARAQSLMEDVHTEATDLFANIKDAAGVALPFAEKEIRALLNSVLAKLGDVSQHPRQVFSSVERAKMSFHLALQRVFESNTIIKQATSSLSGSRSSFMNAGQELSDMADMTRFLTDALRRQRSNGLLQSPPFAGGPVTDSAVDEVLTAADHMAEELDNVTDVAQGLQEGLDRAALYTHHLKGSFQAFKEGIDMVKSRIHALFGQKFHPGFPSQRRHCDATCGCGYYPTGGTRYGHPGVDLKWDPGWQIVSPVAGLATPAGNDSVSIQPATSGFTGYEIILSNVRLSVQLNVNGTFIDAGQELGVPVGANGCDDSHFHLAVKRRAEDADSVLCYYVDPSPFLDPVQPVPTWHEECKDFVYKHIGSVVGFSKLRGGGFSKFLQVLTRFAVDAGKGLLQKQINKLPNDGFLGVLKGVAAELVEEIEPDASNLKSLFRRAGRKGGGGGMKRFFRNISLRKFNLTGVTAKVRRALGGLNGTRPGLSLNAIKGFIGKARNLTKSVALDGLKSMAMGGLKRLLTRRLRRPGTSGPPGSTRGCASRVVSSPATGGSLESRVSGQSSSSGSRVGLSWDTVVTGRLGMMSRLKTSACNACPNSLGSALARLSGSMCLPHSDCLGLDCEVSLRGSGLTSLKIALTVKADGQRRTVAITANGHTGIVLGDSGASGTVAAQFRVGGVYTVKVKVRSSWQGSQLRLTLSLVTCAQDHCLPDVHVLRDVTVQSSSSSSPPSTDDEDDLGDLESMPFDVLGKVFSDLNLPLGDVMEQINGIQEEISTALKTNGEQARTTMTAEFINPLDHIDVGDIPTEEIYMPFFYFVFKKPLGPVILSMDFDAGGAFGIAFNYKVRALDSFVKSTFKPWVSGRFRAGMSVSIVVASAGIDLYGWVLKTGFPLSLSSNFNKFPVVATKSLDLELIPIELKLVGWVKIFFFINIRKTLWHYRAPAISTTIWEKQYRQDDQEAPRFPLCTGARRRREITSSGPQCSVHQVKGQHPKDSAFKLEFAVEDKGSDLELSYAVGDYPGGTNVLPWTPMGGSSLLSPARFPCGVPLYFLVRARNTQGLQTTASCSIPTFDCTFPDGRLEASRCSSHPSILKSTLIMFEDSELEAGELYHGLGYSPSAFGHELVDWQQLTVHRSQPLPGVTGDLKYFGAPRSGRLTSTPQKSSKASTAEDCASLCLQLSTCVSFVYHQYLHDCELHQVIEGPNAERKAGGHFTTYERLGNRSYTASLLYRSGDLRHGVRYYANVGVQNVLGFRATLSSQGTMVDLTPPHPGPVGAVLSDNVTAGGCHVSILQRCQEHVPGTLNHRMVIDGADSNAVFTGNRKGQHMAYTIENYQAAANWDGFSDGECGILGYTWSVGRSVGGTDVVPFRDPHAGLHSPEDWTYSGLAKGLHLPDGPYYVTVQAVSDILQGGDLVTTVCHSTPFVVDTTPPTFHAVLDFLFDDSFRFLVVYYNVSDSGSGVARMEFGLGRTKYDVMIRRYLPLEMRGVEGNTYLVNEEFETQDGVPAWIRLKVVNNVGLAATGSSLKPILLDNTPPVAGEVLDGAELGQDICCQMSTTEICAQWMDFYDPEANIESYDWGVGLSPGTDDVVRFHTLSGYVKHSCAQVTLRHNVTYFSTVVANNKALNTKSANSSSDGLLIDVTPPVAGRVSDGSDVNHDVNYTSETATVVTSWSDFYDEESGLRDYSVTVKVNGQERRTFPGLDSNARMFADHSFSLQHQDTVIVQLQAYNKAGGQVTVSTDGMLVDHTPPELVALGPRNSSLYQLRDDALQFVFTFQDPESGVGEYRCVIMQLYQGRKTKFWPEVQDFHPVVVNVTTPPRDPPQSLSLEDLSLQNGASYSLQVTALNRAKMAATHQSQAVTVDSTPPVVLEVTLAKEGEEEEIGDDGTVMHAEKEPLWVSWAAQDTESGIRTSHVCVGPADSSDCLFSSSPSSTSSPSSPSSLTHQYRVVDASSPSSLSFRGLSLEVSTGGRQVPYRAYVVTFNAAGVQSGVAMSRPFLVIKANVAGVVLDGRDPEAGDVDFSDDKASIAITFSGFSSEACGIAGYEWGVGTSPFATDLLPFSQHGLVVVEDGEGTDSVSGFAQAHLRQEEGRKYFSTVRARTGYNCHEPYILASSDGFVLDTTPPAVSFFRDDQQVTPEETVYQTSPTDRLPVLWKAEDASGLQDVELVQDVFGSSPQVSRVPAVPDERVPLRAPISTTSTPIPSSGDTLFSALVMTDKAGNERRELLPPVTWDTTPPAFLNLSCSEAVSVLAPLLRCGWDTVREDHSALSDVLVGLGNGPSVANLLNMTSVTSYSGKWTYDVHGFLSGDPDLGYLYVILQAVNAAGLRTERAVKVMHDVSPPSVENVTVVTSPFPGFHDVPQQCQTSRDHIEVLLTGLSDPESDVSSVELALGSSEGRSDVTPFREWPVRQGLYVMGGLSLSPGARVHVTARVTNSVGLYTLAWAAPVVISPQPCLEVTDGPGEADVDGQSELHVLQGRWRYSDPCPVLEAHWSVRELGTPHPVINTTVLDVTTDLFYNDRLRLRNLKTYVSYVRIRDALNRTRVAFSDGVTVLIRRPDTAEVRDGPGQADMDFQEDTQVLSANWDTFGDFRSSLPSDQIIRYEAAVGTNKRYSASRSDVHGFRDVGLDTNVTFYGLNLTAKTQTYYVTVRAHSAAGSYVESSSDGLRAGFSGDVTSGRVLAPGFQSSVSSLRLSWSGFDSDMVITHYYVGVSSQPPLWDNATHDCAQFLSQHSPLFDAHPLQTFGAGESMAVLTNMSLQHAASYYVSVIAGDKMGHCSAAAASGPVVVDTTAPLAGQVKVEGYDSEAQNNLLIFLHSAHTLTVQLGEDFPDPESGVESVSVELAFSASCLQAPSDGDLQSLRTVTAKNQTKVSLRGLDLEEGRVYYARVAVTNRAGLTTRAVSPPLLLDASPPRPGAVKLGTQWTRAGGRSFQNNTHTVSAMVGLLSLQPSAQGCGTQTDLLTEDLRGSWLTKDDAQFSTQCVHLDDSGLHVSVQHNPYLTGVDRGAAQYGPEGWREGDYIFRLTPALGDRVISGISLASPALQPPFLRHNSPLTATQSPTSSSSLPCNSSFPACRNQTLQPGSLGADDEYGLGLTFGRSANGSSRLLFWTQDVLQVKHSWLPVESDPEAAAGDYTLRLSKRQESGTPLWEVDVLLNGITLASVSGLLLPGVFVLSVYGWNVDDYFPPLTDPFHPFRASIVVEGLSVPVATRPLCSYGSAFRDDVSDVKEVWAGVSDSDNATSNIAPYTLIKSFCLPCLHRCSHICSNCSGNDRLPVGFTVVPVVLQGLSLQAGDEAFANSSSASEANKPASGSGTQLRAAKDEFSQYQMPTYYLDIRVVDHSGLETHVKSSGLVIDTSPPVFTSAVCFNPQFSRDVNITELGNTRAVGVTWQVTEDISGVTEVQVGLGSTPGADDLVKKRPVKDKGADQHVFDGLALEEGEEYYIVLEAENEAGLRSQAVTNFTVRTSRPAMPEDGVRMKGVAETVQVSNVSVAMVRGLRRLELSLDSANTSPSSQQSDAGDEDVEYYELAISTGMGTDNVFPRTVVGRKGAKKIAIVNGFVQREESPVPISIGDYTKKNISTSDRPDRTANSLNMEPGRCLDVRVYGVSKAHVASSVDRLVCVKRPGDVMLTADGQRHTLQLRGSSFTVDPKRPASNPFTLRPQLSRGGCMVGKLWPSELAKEYGSSASIDFSPYVVSADPHDSRTSRWLKKRVKAMPGPHVFLSPMADAAFAGDTEVTYVVPRSVRVPDSESVSLLIWNPVAKEWESPKETCGKTHQTYDRATRTLTAKLCAKMFSDDPATAANGRRRRKRRSTVTTSGGGGQGGGGLGPRMMTVAVITTSIPNQPPLVHNTSVTLQEDNGPYTFTLTYTDLEGDEMTFQLARQSAHGTAQVTPEGEVSYVPDANYIGKDVVHVQGTEVMSAAELALGMTPNVIHFSVNVYVTEVNDPPDIFYLPNEGEGGSAEDVQHEIAVGPAAGNGLNMTVYTQANGSTALPLGLVVFSDVDAQDSVVFLSSAVLDPGTNFTEKYVALDHAQLRNLSLTPSSGARGKELVLGLPAKTYTGHVVYDARARDGAGSYSLQLTLNVFVLHNPCVHGVCRPRSSQDTCQEPRRAFGFYPYYECACHPGYEGEWCQIETDECLTAVCSPITDCVDLINGFRCDFNKEKLAAIVVACCLAVVLTLSVIYKLKKRSSKVGDNTGYEKDVSPTRAVTPAPPVVESSALQGAPVQLGFLEDPYFAYVPCQNPAFPQPLLTPEAAGSGTGPASTGLSQGKLRSLRGSLAHMEKGPSSRKTSVQAPSSVLAGAGGAASSSSPPPLAGQTPQDSGPSASQSQCPDADADRLTRDQDVTRTERPSTGVKGERSTPGSASSAGRAKMTGNSDNSDLTRVDL